MLTLFLLFTLGEPRTLDAHRADWSELESKVFPESWILPESLWLPKDASRALPLALAKLLDERFDAPAGKPWMASVGDVIAEHRRRGGTRVTLDALLQELLAERPSTHARLGKLLGKLLSADALRNPKWDPSEARADDGVYFGELLERNAASTSPWKEHGGATTLHQAAVFVRADLESFAHALHDYEALLHDPGTSYEKLAPKPESIVRGADEAHGPFAALRLSIRSDLPFPFSHYDCDLGVLHRLDAQKHLVTYVFSPSRDFYWLAGEDLHLPVRTSDGEWQGTLVVRLSGFDLRRVPDGDDERKSGTRGALGNLKRRAEADFERAGGKPRTQDGALPEFCVVAPAGKKD